MQSNFRDWFPDYPQLLEYEPVSAEPKTVTVQAKPVFKPRWGDLAIALGVGAGALCLVQLAIANSSGKLDSYRARALDIGSLASGLIAVGAGVAWYRRGRSD
ncbi:MAG: hypothetical protein AAF329_00420 [Cyanobacteria bacterium P01_A01_bin.17]